MQFLKNIFKRNIYYSQEPVIDEKLKPWAIFMIINKQKNEKIDKFIEECVKNDVLHVCISGSGHMYYHFKFDEKIVDYEIKFKKELNICTSSNRSIKKELEYAIFLGFHPDKDIKNIVCYDFSKKSRLKDLKKMLEELDKEHNS